MVVKHIQTKGFAFPESGHSLRVESSGFHMKYNGFHENHQFPLHSMKDQEKVRDLCRISCFLGLHMKSIGFHVKSVGFLEIHWISVGFHMKSSGLHEIHICHRMRFGFIIGY